MLPRKSRALLAVAESDNEALKARIESITKKFDAHKEVHATVCDTDVHDGTHLMHGNFASVPFAAATTLQELARQH